MQPSARYFPVSFALLIVAGSACADHEFAQIEAEQYGTESAPEGPEDSSDPSGESPHSDDADESGDHDGGSEDEDDGDDSSQPPPPPEGPLGEIPEEQWEPGPNPDGVPQPLPGVYDDLGPADPDDPLRALIGLSLRDRQGLDDFLAEVSDPTSDIFGQYLGLDEFMQEHAPLAEDAELLAAWLDYVGFEVQAVARSRMLIHFHGTVEVFNEAFDTNLHLCLRKNPQHNEPPFVVYCAHDSMSLPAFIADRSPGVITCDLPAVPGTLTQEGGQIQVAPPEGVLDGIEPARMAAIYDLEPLWAQGYDGSGQGIAVITGTRPHFTWMQTFWQSFGITRSVPTVVPLLEPASIRAIEATLNPAWAGAMAPGAKIIQYAGPDTRNSSTVFVYNEAIARMPGDGASVLTSSLAHREDSEPKLVRDAYDAAAAMGAAMGLTLMAASGNSAQTDTPSSSPYSLAVGGTVITVDDQGALVDEVAWEMSGSGPTLSFPRPPWQDEVAGSLSDKHVVVDLALAAAPGIGTAYWIYWLDEWKIFGGTSFASPAFAGMVAVMNHYRADHGMPPVGFLAPKLYWDADVQAEGFRDIVSGETEFYPAGAGWDVPTGWGAPRVDKLAELVP